MSKTQLKKELYKLDREQLIQLALELYSAKKEAKAYFDFFLDPDLDKLSEKYRLAIDKEMARGKYSKSTARLTRVRSAIREFASFGVPIESVIEMMLYTLKNGLIVEQRRYVTRAFTSGIMKLADDILKTADKHCVFDSTHRLLEEVLSGSYGYRGFVNQIRVHLSWSLI